jgi:hypothetical protein
MRPPPPLTPSLLLSLFLALLTASCQTPSPDSDPLVNLTTDLSSILDANTDCEALGKALQTKITSIDRSLAAQLRRLGASAHRLDEPTRLSLESFSRKFAAANLRCKDALAFKEALASLEGQLDER